MTSVAAAELLQAACETPTKPPPKRIDDKGNVFKAVIDVMAIYSRQGETVGFTVWWIAMLASNEKDFVHIGEFIHIDDVHACLMWMLRVGTKESPLVYQPFPLYDARFFALTKQGLRVAAKMKARRRKNKLAA